MILPCKIESTNGYNIKFTPVPVINEDHIMARLSISNLGTDEEVFVFLHNDKLKRLYDALLVSYKALNSDSIEIGVRTVDLPYVKTYEYIAVIINESGSCMITLKKKHASRDRHNTYTTTNVIYLDSSSLYRLLVVMGKVLFEGE